MIEFWVNYAKTGSLEESLKVNQYSLNLRTVYISREKCKKKIKNKSNNKDEKWQKWLDSSNLLLQLRNYADKTLSNFHFKTY